MFLISLLFCTHNPSTSVCCTVRVPGGSLILGGYLLPGGFLPPLGSSKWGNEGRRCRESTQLCLEGVWALVPEAACPLPALLAALKAKLYLFYLPAAWSSCASALHGAIRRQLGCSMATIPRGAVGPSVLCSLCVSPREGLSDSIQKSLHFCSFLVPSFGHSEITLVCHLPQSIPCSLRQHRLNSDRFIESLKPS